MRKRVYVADTYNNRIVVRKAVLLGVGLTHPLISNEPDVCRPCVGYGRSQGHGPALLGSRSHGEAFQTVVKNQTLLPWNTWLSAPCPPAGLQLHRRPAGHLWRPRQRKRQLLRRQRRLHRPFWQHVGLCPLPLPMPPPLDAQFPLSAVGTGHADAHRSAAAGVHATAAPSRRCPFLTLPCSRPCSYVTEDGGPGEDGNARVQKFSPQYQFLLKVGGPGSGNLQVG